MNKTDTNDAHGIAQVVRSGWYLPVAVKSMHSCRVRAILAARRQLVEVRTGLYNQIRGLLKTFGVVLGSGTGGTFERAVNAECPDDPMVRDAVGALLCAWRVAGERKVALERQLVRIAREQDVCRRLATVPGVGAITSLTFVTALDDPTRFRRSCDVGAYLGLNNAVKYGGAARVALDDRHGEVVVTVEDDGTGIPEEEMEAVFEPFRRLEQSRNRGTGGSGLGLTIARRAVESHGGTVVLANRPAGGLVATVRLPRSSVHERRQA